MPLTGILILDKPTGITSRRAVDAVVRCVRPSKAGHAGTLDPLASGVLVVCVGKATRLIEYVQRMPKHYRGTFLLGRSSATEDVEGVVEELDNPRRPTIEEWESACVRMTGEIQQRPPVFSALKVSGKRAYALARAGKPVDLAPRTVVVHRLAVERYEYPELVLDVECGSGTYIRSLGRDLAESVGTAAVMSGLVRTAIGDFKLEEACSPEQLNQQSISKLLLPARRAVESLPAVWLTREECDRVARGVRINRPGFHEKQELAALDQTGELAAVIEACGDGTLRVVRNLRTPDLGGK